jgi:hypothetical protein
MIKKIPLTNREDWRTSFKDVFNRYGMIYYKEECFFHTDFSWNKNQRYYFTGHLYRINDLMEGIEIHWDGNPFNLKSHI